MSFREIATTLPRRAPHWVLASALLLGCLAAETSAQVVRCTDPTTGRVTYTDGACAQGQSRKEVAPRPTEQELQQQYEQAQAALQLQRERERLREAERAASRRATPPQSASTSRAAPADPALSSACQNARSALQAAMALDPTMYDTNARIHAAQQEADLACLTPAEYARLQERVNNRPPTYVAPGWTHSVTILPPPPPRPRPHHHSHRPHKPHCPPTGCTDTSGPRPTR